jgi:asparagine synthase (glutamine-hydrolysing)
MCGISGILSRGGTYHEEEIGAMNSRQRRRGPDGTGSCRVSLGRTSCTLGHTRLAILDREGGGQPMVAPESGVAIVFNGEIYNHPLLRRQLETAGCRFRSRSDTEVLLHGYHAWGIDGLLARIDGMFAFALADPCSGQLILARDPAGQKPLYYTQPGNGERFAFASTLRALTPLPWFDRRIDQAAVELFLTLRIIPAPYSIYTGARKLPPGCYLIYDNGKPLVREYWSPLTIPQQERPASAPLPLEEYRSLLRDSLAQTLAADEPVALLLSSGLDSASLACELARLPQRDTLTAYTISFPDTGSDEAAMAAAIARSQQLSHRVLSFDATGFAAQLAPLEEIIDEPFGDPGILPCLQLCRTVAATCRVAITGDGGDELFGGYPTFAILPWWPLINRFPRLGHRLCSGAASLLPAGGGGYPLEMKIRRLAQGLGEDDIMAFARWLCVFTPEETANLRGTEESGLFREFVGDRLAGLQAADPVDIMCRAYFRLFLPGVLEKMDRAAMHYSLETRAPFLQRPLMEFALGLPSRCKLHHGTTKVIMRRALQESLPSRLVSARKRGFAPPLAAAFAGEWGHGVEGLLTAAGDSFGLDRRRIDTLLGEQRSRRRDHSAQLWLIYQLALFLRNGTAGQRLEG